MRHSALQYRIFLSRWFEESPEAEMRSKQNASTNKSHTEKMKMGAEANQSYQAHVSHFGTNPRLRGRAIPFCSETALLPKKQENRTER